MVTLWVLALTGVHVILVGYRLKLTLWHVWLLGWAAVKRSQCVLIYVCLASCNTLNTVYLRMPGVLRM